jgi:hypothetical protein
MHSPVCSHAAKEARYVRAWYIKMTSAVICDGALIPHVDCVMWYLTTYVRLIFIYRCLIMIFFASFRICTCILLGKM